MIWLLVPGLSKDPLDIILGHAVRWIKQGEDDSLDSPLYKREVCV